jgi:hypothetical protein
MVILAVDCAHRYRLPPAEEAGAASRHFTQKTSRRYAHRTRWRGLQLAVVAGGTCWGCGVFCECCLAAFTLL